MADGARQLRLGVNIDHVATVRNARGGDHPCPVEAARRAAAGGADGITAHLREDRRHIRDDDIRRLKTEVALPLNMELAATPEMQAIALAVAPFACCLVPERRAELTTEGGLDVAGNQEALAQFIPPLREQGIRVSLFIDPQAHQVEAAQAVGAAAVELHTGTYAEASGPDRDTALAHLVEAAAQADDLGLEVHAGHGLSYDNVPAVAAIPQIVELNIGHFLVGQAIFDGLAATVAEMRRIMTKERFGA